MLNQYRRGCSFYRARYLRAHMTIVEKILWIELRKKRFSGYIFRRQAPIGNYIADFLYIKLKLIVELDGPSHEHQQGYDAQRTKCLNAKDYHVLRFSNDAVLANTEGVLEKIKAVCLQLSA